LFPPPSPAHITHPLSFFSATQANFARSLIHARPLLLAHSVTPYQPQNTSCPPPPSAPRYAVERRYDLFGHTHTQLKRPSSDRFCHALLFRPGAEHHCCWPGRCRQPPQPPRQFPCASSSRVSACHHHPHAVLLIVLQRSQAQCQWRRRLVQGRL